MPPVPRGSPLRDVLLLGTCFSLALPIAPALAEPAKLPDWGMPSKAAPAPAPAAPAAAPSPSPGPSPAATAPTSEPDAEPSPRRANRRAPKATPTAKARPQKQPGVAAQELPERERRAIQDHARGLEAAGKLEDAARSLAVGAEAYDDPLLHLSAADAYLRLARSRGRTGVADDDRCLAHVRAARALLDAPTGEPRVDPAQHATVLARADELGRQAERHKARMSVRRNGHGEVIAGAMLTTAGIASLGVMSGGLYLNRLSERELGRGEGRPADELAPLHAQERRAETMIAAGAIAGAAGLALGIALLTIGARDLKAARSEPLAARLRVAPTIGGLALAGRF